MRGAPRTGNRLPYFLRYGGIATGNAIKNFYFTTVEMALATVLISAVCLGEEIIDGLATTTPPCNRSIFLASS